MPKIVLDIAPLTLKKLLSALDNAQEALLEDASRRRSEGDKEDKYYANEAEKDSRVLGTFSDKLKKYA
jgi:hypothetical protein